MVELEDALQLAKGKTPGDDRISYPMLKNLPKCSKDQLLSIYNNIFSSKVYLQTWKIATVVPIPNPKVIIRLSLATDPFPYYLAPVKPWKK